MEFLGSNPSVEARSRHLAQTAFDAAHDRARTFLEKFYTGEDAIITAEQVEEMARRKGQEAFDQSMLDRDMGKRNDIWSIASGLSALVTINCIDSFTALVDRPQPTPTPPTVTELETGLYAVHLPLGAFQDTASGSLFIYPEALVDENSEVIRTLTGELPTEDDILKLDRHFDVVRIEGQSGELWQNPHMAADGSPR